MADMVRRLCWTVIFGCIVAAIMLSILLAWEADPMNVDEPLNDNYAAYLGAMQLMSDSIGYPFPVMTEVQFRQACEDDGYVHTSLIDMDAFEAAFQRS